MSDCSKEGCPYASDISNMKNDLERNSSQHREFYDKITDFTTKQALADERYNNILAVVSEIKLGLTEIKDKPAKKWDNLSWLVISTIVSLILGAVIGSLI